MASSFLSSGTISFMKWIEEYVDHAKAISTQASLITMWTYLPMKRFNRAAMLRGNRQYPRRQILQKNEMVPPKSCPLIAITAPPSQTMTNTVSNKSVLSSAFVTALKTIASMRQKKKGPQRSQFLISRRFSSLSTLWNGFMTIFNFYQILTRSLF